MPIIPALRRLEQEDHTEFKAALGYIRRLCLRNTKARVAKITQAWNPEPPGPIWQKEDPHPASSPLNSTWVLCVHTDISAIQKKKIRAGETVL